MSLPPRPQSYRLSVPAYLFDRPTEADVEALTLQHQAETRVLHDPMAAGLVEVTLRVMDRVAGPLDDREVHLVKLAAALAQTVPISLITG